MGGKLVLSKKSIIVIEHLQVGKILEDQIGERPKKLFRVESLAIFFSFWYFVKTTFRFFKRKRWVPVSTIHNYPQQIVLFYIRKSVWNSGSLE